MLPPLGLGQANHPSTGRWDQPFGPTAEAPSKRAEDTEGPGTGPAGKAASGTGRVVVAEGIAPAVGLGDTAPAAAGEGTDSVRAADTGLPVDIALGAGIAAALATRADTRSDPVLKEESSRCT